MRNVSDKRCTEDQNNILRLLVIRKSFGLRSNVEEYDRARQATDDNRVQRRKHAICIPDNKGKHVDAHHCIQYAGCYC